MNWLVTIYLVSIVLVLLTLTAALALVVRRSITERTEARHEVRRKTLLGEVLEALDDKDFPSALAARMSALPELTSEVLEELLELIRGDNQRRLLQIAHEAGMREWLHRRLRMGRKVHRRMAADMLRFFDDEETIAALQRALDDPEEEVRLTATLSLTAIHGGQPMLPILQRFRVRMHSRSLRLRQIFERMSQNDQEAALRVALGDLGDDSLRPLAIEALASTAGEQLALSLVQMAHDPLPSVRRAVISTLGAMASSKASEAVEEALGDENWEVRVAGIEAARRLDLMDLVPRLAGLVEDKVWTVRLHAAEALGKLGEAGADALRLLSGGAGDEGSRTLAAAVLARRSGG
jgi:HEAT repeat protein